MGKFMRDSTTQACFYYLHNRDLGRRSVALMIHDLGFILKLTTRRTLSFRKYLDRFNCGWYIMAVELVPTREHLLHQLSFDNVLF
jgi:hypothetical protein